MFNIHVLMQCDVLLIVSEVLSRELQLNGSDAMYFVLMSS